MGNEGIYIYCIIGSNQPLSFGPMGIGGRGDEVYTICSGDLGAVVSKSPEKEYRVSRENTLAHEKAIEAAMKEHTVLPVRFCTIADDEEMVKKILEREHDTFKDMLDKIADKKELGMKAIFIKDAIYHDILEKYEDIRILKEKIASIPPEKAYYQHIKIGEMVETALEKEKEIYKTELLDAFSPLAVDDQINNPYGELMIMNAAFLVENCREPEFDQAVEAFATKYKDKIKYKYVGTIPPFNFVNLVIDIGQY